MPGGSSWLHHVPSFCPHQVTVKCKCSLMSRRQQPSSHTASHEAACLVWIGPDSPPRPVAITIHSKSDLQRWPTLKRLCSSPLCFACLSWLTPYYMPPSDGGRALVCQHWNTHAAQYLLCLICDDSSLWVSEKNKWMKKEFLVASASCWQYWILCFSWNRPDASCGWCGA